jgi:hypothetical protein
MNFPKLTSSTKSISESALQVFKTCTEYSIESDDDRNNRMFIELKSILTDFWSRVQLGENDDGEFNIHAYFLALSILHNTNVFPVLPFHYKANAFIDVIGPRVYCPETQVCFIPHIGTTEYMDSCQSIHDGNIEIIDAGFDSDIIANDKYADSITCFD